MKNKLNVILIELLALLFVIVLCLRIQKCEREERNGETSCQRYIGVGVQDCGLEYNPSVALAV